METVSIEVPPEGQPSIRKRSPGPPKIEMVVASTPASSSSIQRSNQKPRRRRIRSELDRLLSDEGTRNMLRGLKKPGSKIPPVFRRGKVEKKVARGGRVFRKPIVARRRNSSVAKGPGVTKVEIGVTGRSSRGGSVTKCEKERSASPGKTREVKIDCKFVVVSRRGGTGWVTVVSGGGDMKEGGDGEEGEGGVKKSVDGAWGIKTLQSIDSAIRSLDGDNAISVIVVQNTHSRYWCNGVDLGDVLGGKGRICGVLKAMKSLISTLNSSRKLLVASVSGDCVGFGVMVLPLFDLVYANDKSCFRVHYKKLRQNPEGVANMATLLCSGGTAAAHITSLLYLNRSLTATEALASGLVNEILWPATYSLELAVRLQSLSNQGDLVCSSKMVVKTYKKGVKAADINAEFSVIEDQWSSPEFQQRARSIVCAGDYENCFWRGAELEERGGVVNGGSSKG